MNALVTRRLFAGETAGNLAAIRDAVAVNAAAALAVWDPAEAVGKRDASPIGERIAAVLPRAFAAIDSGAAGDLLERWAKESTRLAGGS